MKPQSDAQLIMPPLVCFGLVLIIGIIGFGNALFTHNGFFLIGFLIVYLPCSLIACVIGAVFAVKAYRGLPTKHKGRHLLTTVISLTVLGIVLCLLLGVKINNSISGP